MRARVRRALISVSDKHGIEGFARSLHGLGVELVSTGGSARLLEEAGLPVAEVFSLTGFPEIMGGRVKTLHPRVHGGLLGRRGTDDAVMREHGIEPIDLLVVNLYPFERTIARPGCPLAEAVENIDIGGPAMLRAAAKNHADVATVSDPDDYSGVIEELRRNAGALSAETRLALAVKAFARTAHYDAAIADYLGSVEGAGRPPAERSPFPAVLAGRFFRETELRYGENPHQAAALYRDRDAPAARPTVAAARLAQGKPLSFNNIADADAALECVRALGAMPACVIVKHANPCGAAVAASAREAYERAFRTDPTSAFGGIVAFNRPLDGELARAVLERQFVEVLVAPSIVGADAAAALAAKPGIRVLVTGEWECEEPSADVGDGGCGGENGGEGDGRDGGGGCPGASPLDIRSVGGGILVQEADHDPVTQEDFEVVTRRAPTPSEWNDLLFAWRIVRFVKSNAIVYVRSGATLGIGAGQTSRVHSARIGRLKAEEEGLALCGSAMASDAFFPFRDGIDAAAEAGVAAVIQPGGSRRDAEVIAAANEHAMAMVLTGVRHFRH